METVNKLNKDDDVIDLLELFRYIRKYWYFVVICGLLGALAMFLCTNFLMTPKYQSKASLYVLSNTSNSTSMADLQIGGALAEDYIIIAESQAVITEAVKLLDAEGLSLTNEEVSQMMSAKNISTRIVDIYVTSIDPVLSAQVANALVQASISQMAQITKTDPPSVLEWAKPETNPVSPNLFKNILLGMLVGIVGVCGILVVIFLLDDNIKSEDDIQKYLGLSTLAKVPYISERERR